jgi:hypothetical protein
MDVDEVLEAGPGEDLQYLQRRAEEELEAAQRSTVPEVTAAHYQLAEAYLERLDAKRATPASSRGADEPAGSERGEPVADRARKAGHPREGWSGR